MSWLFVVPLLCWLTPAVSEVLTEDQIKAAFLYNFTTFTEWPTEVGAALNLCLYGQDPIGVHLDELHGRPVGDRQLSVQHIDEQDDLEVCQVVFIARSRSDELPQLIKKLHGKPVLTIADTPGAEGRGVAINMGTKQSRITFKINLTAVRGNGLNLSSKLLNLAEEVR